MSYAILRTQKIKDKRDYMAAVRHHYRIGGLENADPSKTHLNYEAFTHEEAEKRFDDFFDKTTGKFSKRRKDAVLCIDYLLTASPEFFETATADEVERYFETCKEWLFEKHGEENLLLFTIEYDESTPHCTAIFAPVDDKGKLSAKHFLGGRDKLRAMQDDFHKFVNDRGFDLKRGNAVEHTRAKHGLVKDFYKDLKKMIKNGRFHEMKPEQLQVAAAQLFRANEKLLYELQSRNWDLERMSDWFYDCATGAANIQEFVEFTEALPKSELYDLGLKLKRAFNFPVKKKTGGVLNNGNGYTLP